MSGYPLVRFTSAPDVSGTVRFDFQAGPSSVINDGFTAGTPSLEGTRYGMRQLGLTAQFKGAKSETSRAIANLARELARRENWLMFQMSPASDPRWFKTYQTTPGDVSLDEVYSSDESRDVWDVGVTLDAEGLAYGERVTLPEVIVYNDPASPFGTGTPCTYVLPEVRGDAATRLRVGLVKTVVGKPVSGRTVLVAAQSREATPEPLIWQFDAGWTGGTDVAAEAAGDADMSAGTYRRVSFATVATLGTRFARDELTGPTPPHGRFRVLVRVRASDLTSTYTMRIAQPPRTGYFFDLGSDVTFGDTVPYQAKVAGPSWVDLGVIASAPHVLPGDIPAAPHALAVQAGRESGAGTLDFDAMLFVPTNTTDGHRFESLQWQVPALVDADGFYRTFDLDGDAEALRVIYGDEYVGVGRHVTKGGFLEAVPGAENALTLIRHLGSDPGVDSAGADIYYADDLTAATRVYVSYHPRYLLLGSS